MDRSLTTEPHNVADMKDVVLSDRELEQVTGGALSQFAALTAAGATSAQAAYYLLFC